MKVMRFWISVSFVLATMAFAPAAEASVAVCEPYDPSASINYCIEVGETPPGRSYVSAPLLCALHSDAEWAIDLVLEGETTLPSTCFFWLP